MKDNNGNPVPSLQKIKEESIEYFKKNKIDWKDTRVTSNFIIYLLKKYENGVETDNEQPNECKCSGDTACMCT
jgi:hypothetical protein